jgi:hypothetical protein
MMIATRARIVETLESLAAPQARTELAHAMRESNMVARCLDSYGRSLYLPTPASDLLVDRLFALVGADVLNAPADFDRNVICNVCSAVTIGPAACCVRTELGRQGVIMSVQPATVRFDVEEKIAAGF